MDNHKLISINNFIDVLEVRKIRNECRLFMTNYTNEISISNQLKWYFNVYKNENKKGNIETFIFKFNNKNAGFGLIQKKSNNYWITGGLSESQRGRGLGEKLFLELLNRIPSNEVWLEVIDTNIAAKRIYAKLGFKKVKKIKIDGKDVIVMKLIK